VPLFYEDSLGAKLSQKWNELGSADDELIDDPAALEAAQRAADGVDPEVPPTPDVSQWVPLLSAVRLSGMMTMAGAGGFALTSALDAAGIPHTWDPYPPEEMPAFRPAYGAIDRPFTLLVPAEQLTAARAALDHISLPEDAQPDAAPDAPPAVAHPDPDRLADAAPDAASHAAPVIPRPADSPPWWKRRRLLAWLLVAVFVGPGLLLAILQLYLSLTGR
jgi:hypothetical protein